MKNNKKQKRITDLVIIDASGSMHNKAEEVRTGLKDLFKDIKERNKENPKVKNTVIVCQFSTAGHFKVLAKSHDELNNDLADQYTTSGMTALYDAIAQGIALVPEKQDGVFVNILTDGEENDSKEHTADSIKSLLKEADDKKWGITFMGTTKQAVEDATKRLGIHSTNTTLFVDSAEGIQFAYTKRKTASDTYYSSIIKNEKIKTQGLMEDDKDDT